MTVYFARDLFLPIMIGLIVALTLSPVVRSLARLGVPEPLSAVLLILGACPLYLPERPIC
jgi:predicted PurR-regulated permease PerM